MWHCTSPIKFFIQLEQLLIICTVGNAIWPNECSECKNSHLIKKQYCISHSTLRPFGHKFLEHEPCNLQYLMDIGYTYSCLSVRIIWDLYYISFAVFFIKHIRIRCLFTYRAKTACKFCLFDMWSKTVSFRYIGNHTSKMLLPLHNWTFNSLTSTYLPNLMQLLLGNILKCLTVTEIRKFIQFLFSQTGWLHHLLNIWSLTTM